MLFNAYREFNHQLRLLLTNTDLYVDVKKNAWNINRRL